MQHERAIAEERQGAGQLGTLAENRTGLPGAHHHDVPQAVNTVVAQLRREAPSSVHQDRLRHDPSRYDASAALLWDLDNVIVKGGVPAMAVALIQLVGSSAPLVVAARRLSFRAHRASLSEAGFEVLSGGRQHNGADRRLIERARVLRRAGVGHFVLASNDGDLARLAKLGSLHVVTHDPTHLSARLAAVAETVSVLALEEGPWSVARTDAGATQ